MQLFVAQQRFSLISGGLSGFAPAACEKAVCGVRPVRLNEHLCAASLIQSTAILCIRYACGTECFLVKLFMDVN
jgi:hypothetical protein